MNRSVRKTLVFASAVALAIPAQASLLAYEGFSYGSNQNLNGLAGGSGWSGDWIATGAGPSSHRTSSPGLTYGSLPTEGGAMTGNLALSNVRREFAPQSGRVWASALLRFNTLPTNHFLEFKLHAPGNVNQAAQFKINGGNLSTNHDFGSAAASTPWTPTVGETYFIVFTYAANGASPTAVYVNPTLGLAAPQDWAARASFNSTNWGVSSIGGFRLYGDTVNVTLDEIRVGTSFQEVAPVPEPATLTLLGAGLAAVALRRRRR